MQYKLTIPGRLPGLNELIEAERSNRYKGAQLKKDAEHDVKAILPYIRSILDRCQAQGIHTLAAWQAAHRGGGGKRVDRPAPSGNDFLADAVERPRRHKRKET